MLCQIKIKDKSSCVQITELKKGDNIIVRNIISTNWIVNTVNTTIIYSFSEATIECLLKLKNKLIGPK